MPDLNDELRAILRHRADDAPAVPAPTDRLVRSVRRRQAVRTSLALAGATLGVVAVVAVAAAAIRPDTAVAPPAANPTSIPPDDDKYFACTAGQLDQVAVAVHASELKFQYGCYRVAAGATSVTFTNPQQLPHNLLITPEGSTQSIFSSKVITADGLTATLSRPLAVGDYALTCQVHPAMHAQLVVR